MADELGKLVIDLDISQALKQAEKLDKEINSIDTKLDVTADTSKAEKQLKDVTGTKKADVKVNADSSKAKSELKDVTKDREVKIDAKVNTGNVDSVLDGLKGKFSELGGGLNDAFGSLKGGDLTGAFGQLTGSVTSFLGPVGLATTAVLGLGTAIYDVVSETAGLQTQVQQFTGLTGDELTRVTADISAISKTFEQDFNETLRATNSLAKGMGISVSEASKIIEDGFINGANASGELLAQLTEYPGFFKEAGYNAKEMADFIALSTKEGIFSDKGADLVKEFGLRIREMTPATKDALKGIGLSGDELQAQLKAGTITQKEALETISKQLGKFSEQSAEVGTVVADVFGGPGEDAGIRFIKLLGDQEAALGGLNGALTDAQKQQKAQLEISKAYEQVIGSITQALTPAITAIQTFIADGVKGMIDGFKAAYDVIKPFVAFVKDYLVTVWDNVVQVIKNVFLTFYPLYELIKALWPVIKIALSPVIAVLAVQFGILYGAMKLLNIGLKALGDLFVWIGKWIKNNVTPVFEGVEKALSDFLDTVIEMARKVPFLGKLLDKFGIGVDDVGNKTKKVTKITEDDTKAKEKNTEVIKKQTDAAKVQSKTLQQIYDEQKAKLIGLETAKNRDVKAIKAQTDATKKAFKELSDYNKKVAEITKRIEDKKNEAGIDDILLQDSIDRIRAYEEEQKALDKLRNSYTGIVELSALEELTKVNDDLNNQALQIDTITAALELAKTAFGENSEQALILQKRLNELKPPKTFTEGIDSIGASLKEQLAVSGEVFGQLLTGEKDYREASLQLAYDSLKQLIPILVAEITGEEIGKFGILGLATSAGLTALLYALFSAAKPQGFKHGGEVKGGRQLIEINEEGTEFVVNAKSTKREKPLLDFINRGGTSEEFFLKHFQDVNLSRPQYSNLVVNQDGVIEELKGMKHELQVIKRASIDTAKKDLRVNVNNNLKIKSDYYR